MKKKIYIVFILLFITSKTTFAHKDFYRTKIFGNVTVTIKTGFEYEEINKLYILGKLAQKLSEELNYSENVSIYCDHHYIKQINNDYFISTKNNKDIVIKQVFKKLEIEKTLKLLEYAILNTPKVTTSQKEITYNKNYRKWKISSIDQKLIEDILNKKNSKDLNQILNTKVDLAEINKTNYPYGIYYYWLSNKYCFYTTDVFGNRKELIVLNDLYFIKELDANFSIIVFTHRDTFHHLSNNKGVTVSKKQKIENLPNHFKPLKIENMGGNKVSLYVQSFVTQTGNRVPERHLIYLTQEDFLIQNLDSLIDHYKLTN